MISIKGKSSGYQQQGRFMRALKEKRSKGDPLLHIPRFVSRLSPPTHTPTFLKKTEIMSVPPRRKREGQRNYLISPKSHSQFMANL